MITCDPCWPQSVRCELMSGSWLMVASTCLGPNTVVLFEKTKLSDLPYSGMSERAPSQEIMFWRPFGTNGSMSRNSSLAAVSYTHLRAHETVLDLVCRLL